MSRNILIVAPYLPWPADFGGAIRIYQFVKHLSRDGHVILFAPASRSEIGAIEHLRDICDVTAVPAPWTFRQPAGIRKRLTQVRSVAMRPSFVELASAEPRVQAVMDRLFMTRQIDIVQYEFPQMARYRPLRPCPTILDNHNVEYDVLARVARTSRSLPQRLFNSIEWRKLRRYERDAWSSVTLNIATSTADANRIGHAIDAPVPVVPNGVDVTAYDDVHGTTRVPGRVVFVGAMRHQPNADAACWYAKQVHPLVVHQIQGATFQIIGADPPPAVKALASETILVTGRVDSVAPYLAAASVAVVPLHAGGGTRLKLLEAFAAGVPVVSTTIGAEGLDAEPGTHMLVADTARAFADAVVCVLRGSGGPPSYSPGSAQQLVRSHYDWVGAVVPALISAHDTAIDRFQHAR